MQRLRERTGLHGRTIQRHLILLEDACLIRRQIGGGAHPSSYFLIEPTLRFQPKRRTAVRHA